MVSRNKYYDILNDHFGEVDGTEFKKYCIVTCGSEYGLLLHDFYCNYIKFIDKDGKPQPKLTKRRINHIGEITSSYPQYKVKKAMEIVISNIKKGKTLKNTVPVTYFEKVLYNLKTKTEKSIENQKNNDQGRGVPVPKERVRDKHEQERFNWEYTCSECGGPVTAWDEECKNCNVWFRWNYVELPCQKK